ncbi:hypothetical protein QOZ80_2AG0150580 [Eleusine coracana subsp. coracana]|nr:hypothetical protein QOZ80_2AG0150580 [Eleusine coracana subsp. coracana]
MRRRPGRSLAAPPGGFLHLSLLASLRRRRPSLQAHAQLLLLGLPLPADATSRLLRPHLRSGHPLASLRLFLRILHDRDRDPPPSSAASKEAIPNSYSLSAALAACSRHAYPTPGLSIHAFLLKSGFVSDLFAANSLLHFYVSFGLHNLARKLFDKMPVRDSVSFNTLIYSYVRYGCIEDALGVFRNMAEAGFRMDGWTVTALLSACSALGDLRAAKAAHGIARRALKQKLFDSGEVVIALVDMYVKCGAVRLARRVFDLSGEKARNVRVWTVMMSGHVRAGEIDMARTLFDEIPDKDLVAWTVMISAFVQAGRYKEALGLFEEMEAMGLEPDEVSRSRSLVANCDVHSSAQNERASVIMGKYQEQRNDKGSKTYVLKVDMHCECTGCVKKITDGIKEISLSEGVERADLVAETGEVKVVGMMNPERLCRVLHEVTKKSVRIVTKSNLVASSGQTKNLFPQAPSDWLAEETSKNGWQNDVARTLELEPVTPSAPPLPAEDWSETVPSERCWYRWPAAASSRLVVWDASDVTVALATYEL